MTKQLDWTEVSPEKWVSDHGTSEAMDEASEQDRVYFEAHPSEEEYYREALPNEWVMACVLPGDLMVHVRQVYPGFRMRTPSWVALAEQ